MSFLSRRDFLSSSFLAVSASYGLRDLPRSGNLLRLSPHDSRRKKTPAAFLPDPVDAARFKEIASHAIDAARAAGASFADIRIGSVQEVTVILPGGALDAQLDFSVSSSWGIRVVADGAMAFLHGMVVDRDLVAQAAGRAVARARGYAKVKLRDIEVLPQQSVSGDWASPVQIAPFSVPIEDHADTMSNLNTALLRVPGIEPAYVETRVIWQMETRAFASSDGSLTSQYLTRCIPNVDAGTRDAVVTSRVPLWPSGSGGFELLLRDPDAPEKAKRCSEQLVALAQLPETRLDPGRYPLVVAGQAATRILGSMVTPAFELDRALNYEANNAGTSAFLPDMLGTKVCSSMLTVTANRSIHDVSAEQWDADGVTPQSTTLIENGVLRDFVGTRFTAPALRAWYDKNGKPVQSNGFSTALQPHVEPMAVAKQIQVAAPKSGATEDDLLRDIKRGIYVREGFGYADFGMQTLSLSGSPIFEVRNGQIVGRPRGLALQTRANATLKGLVAIGDESTVVQMSHWTSKGEPRQIVDQWITTPALSFASIDVNDFMRAASAGYSR